MRKRVGALGLAMVGVLGTGCAQQEVEPAGEAPLETVDIAEDTDFAPESDPRAAPRQGQLAGILPSDFPGDLPLYLPASVEGVGAAGGKRRVSLTSTSSPEQVRAGLAASLSSRGWEGNVGLGESTVRKAGRTVHVSIEKQRFGSLYTFAY